MDELIRQHLQQLNGSLQSLIIAYVTWYTAFWTLNALALAWIFAKTRGEEHDRTIQWLVAVFFGLMNLAGVGSSLFMLKGMNEKTSDMTDLTKALLARQIGGLAGDPVVQRVLATSLYPSSFVTWSLWTCALTVLGMSLLWFFMAYKCRRGV